MSMQTIITKGRKFAESVSKTVVENALDIANDTWNTYGFDITVAQATEIAKGIDTVPARVSEWKAFMLAVPCGLPEALNEYKTNAKLTLTRVKMFALARELKKVGDYSKFKTAIKAVETPTKGKGSNASVGMGIGIIKRVKKDKSISQKQLVEFRKELAKLCNKYGINY